jgi:glycosyltransferase involved in cell wall biosynthesis
MRFSVITANYNGGQFLEQTIQSVLEQQEDVELEYIIVDGCSTDGSIDIINNYADQVSHCIIETDNGPAHAINKGLQLASGDIISWLNADDHYFPGTLVRVKEALQDNTNASMCFGGCVIVNEQDLEIRRSITNFKEFFFPFSSRFTYQCVNYISQPALFFRRDSVKKAGLLREDMIAAWDYEFILRLWRYGNAKRLTGTPLAAFRWYEKSISAENFRIQFQEEYEAAKKDAGWLSVQTGIHFLVRWGIVGIYSAMSSARTLTRKNRPAK